MTTTVETPAPASAAEQFALRRQSPVQRIQHLLHSHPAISPLLVLHRRLHRLHHHQSAFRRAQRPFRSSCSRRRSIAALAIGQTLVILTAGIDLAVGAICILSMLVMANLAANQRACPASSRC